MRKPLVRRRFLASALAWVACWVVSTGCREEQGADSSSPAGSSALEAGPAALRVAVTFEPAAWIVTRLAGDGGADFVVEEPLAAAGDPAFAEPTREELFAFTAADLVVANGAGFERWLDSASLARSRLVLLASALDDPWIERAAVVHRHGPTGEHTHGAIDPHTWLDPLALLAGAREVRGALQGLRPEAEPALAANWKTLEGDLQALDAELRALTPKLAGVRLLASHPAYDYLARRYGWQVTSFDLDPEDVLERDALAERGLTRSADARRSVLLWESEPGAANLALLEDVLGIESVVFSPGETPTLPGSSGSSGSSGPSDSSGGDYLAVQRANVARLASLLTR